jgi:hypothetical protein
VTCFVVLAGKQCDRVHGLQTDQDISGADDLTVRGFPFSIMLSVDSVACCKPFMHLGFSPFMITGA